MKEYDVWYNGNLLCSFHAPSQEDADEMVKVRYNEGVFGYPSAVLTSED